MLLTYSFTGGGGQEAEIEVPEAASFDLPTAGPGGNRSRGRAGKPGSSNNRPRRPSANWPDSRPPEKPGPAPERVSCSHHSKTRVRACYPTINPSPSLRRCATQSEAEAVLLETLRLEEMERRRRSLRTEPLVLSLSELGRRHGPGRRCGDGPPVPCHNYRAHFRSGFRPPRRPRPPHPASQPKSLSPRPGNSSNCSPNSTNGSRPRRHSPYRRRPARCLLLPGCSSRRKLPRPRGPTDPDGWDRIYEGSFLEAVLVTQLSGEFPGPVLANVSVPFYSADRQRVLIPRGARVVGTVAAVAGADQERLAVAFHRIIWPDGRSVSLEFNGLNQIGESALKDEVNRHYFSMFAAAGAVGILSGLTAIGSNPYAGGQAGFQAGASQGLGEGAVRILDRFLNRLPTITIRAGHRLRIWFTGDVLVPPNRNRQGESNDDQTRDRFLAHPHCDLCHVAARARAV